MMNTFTLKVELAEMEANPREHKNATSRQADPPSLPGLGFCRDSDQQWVGEGAEVKEPVTKAKVGVPAALRGE